MGLAGGPGLRLGSKESHCHCPQRGWERELGTRCWEEAAGQGLPCAAPEPARQLRPESKSDKSSRPRVWPWEEQLGQGWSWPEMQNLRPHPSQAAGASAGDKRPREVRYTLTFQKHCSKHCEVGGHHNPLIRCRLPHLHPAPQQCPPNMLLQNSPSCSPTSNYCLTPLVPACSPGKSQPD